MNCQSCNSNRVASIFAHSKDLGNFTYDNLNIDHDGYFPEIESICEGDDADITFCLECGQIQGEFPITDDDIQAAFSFDEDEDEQIKDRPEPVHKITLISGEELNITRPSELFGHRYTQDIKAWEGEDGESFVQFATTINPNEGRLLFAIFVNDVNTIFIPVAYVPMDYLNEMDELNWKDYMRVVSG